MSKRDFFIVIIKLLGFYFIFSVLLSNLPQTYFIFFSQGEVLLQNLVLFAIPMAIIILLCWLLLIKAEYLTDSFKLSKGFDDDRIDFGNLKSVDILKLAILIIGGLLFLNQLFLIFKKNASQSLDNLYPKVEYTYVVITGIKTLIGYLLVSNFRKIAVFFDRKW